MKQKKRPVGVDELAKRGFNVEPYRKPSRTRFLWLPLALVTSFGLVGTMATIPVVLAGTTAVQAAEPAVQFWKEIPSEFPTPTIAERNTIFDKNGAVIAQTWVEDRIELNSLNAISPAARDGLIATEDKNFYNHEGFDPKGTLRAAVTRSGGGSGITQQLIKNLRFYDILGTPEQKRAANAPTIGRKLHELKLAINYENNHSKDEILLTYFNTVAFGGPTVYGIETASQYFFGKPAKNLTVSEASALVGTAQNPVLYNMDDPDKEEAWRGRQKKVLGRMVAEGKITSAESKKFATEKLNFTRKKTRGGSCAQSKYPFYCDYTMNYLASSPRLGATQEERDAILARGGLQIHTHMDPKEMNAIDGYMKKNWGTKNRLIAPTALVEPGTGGVIAMGANRDYGNGPGKTEVNLPLAPAGEGSAYKPFTLAAALNSGMSENDLTFSSECPLRPGKNYDSPPGGFRNSNSCKLQGGKLNYKQATAYSSNTWYVTLEMKVGVEEVKKFSKSVGLAAPDSITNRSLSYALGSVGNSPVAVAAAYASFVNDGIYCPATPVASLTYRDGSEPAIPDNYDPAQNACRSVISPKNAGIVLKSLRANVSGEVPRAFGIKSRVKGHDTGAKSGTNEGFNSAWGHVSGHYALYTNVYDQEKTSRGLAGGVFKGRRTAGSTNTAQATGGELMAALHRGKKRVPLKYDSPNNELVPNQVDQTSFLTVPSVLGMEPEAALGVMKSLGLKANVSKETRSPAPGFPQGVISEQSVPAGEKLARGTTREVVLYETR